MINIGGRHLIIDGFVKDPATLNPDNLKKMFDALVAKLGMTYLQHPTCYEVPIEIEKIDTEEDEGGWSVIAQITTSHIALHTWPARNAFSMDIFSCKDYDPNEAGIVIWSAIGIDNCVVYNVWRDGRRFISGSAQPTDMEFEWRILPYKNKYTNTNRLTFLDDETLPPTPCSISTLRHNTFWA